MYTDIGLLHMAIGKITSKALEASAAMPPTGGTFTGDVTFQGNINGAYSLPTSDGSNGQVLTTDGSGAITFVTPAAGGGGGADLYEANESSPTAQPSATGTNAIAIGDSATASGTYDLSLGAYSSASGGSSFSAQGGTSSGAGATAIGSQSVASGSSSVALGYNADATGSFSAALGRDAQAITASRAVAIGKSRASGDTSFAAAIGSNSNYGATSAHSIAMGQSASASNSWSISIGRNSSASGSYGVVLGGYQAAAVGSYSYAFGHRGKARYDGKYAFGVYTSSEGTSQGGYMVLVRKNTTDATPVSLVSNGGNSTPGSTNQVILPNNSAYTFTGTVIAREKASEGSDYASWEIKGALLRDANAASTVLGNGIQNKLYATSGASTWAIALTADTTNGGLAITVTGAASTDIRWVATVNTSEVTYA